MILHINNIQEMVPDTITTVDDLLTYKKFTFPRIIVKINHCLVRKSEYTTAILTENDHVEVIHMVSGG